MRRVRMHSDARERVLKADRGIYQAAGGSSLSTIVIHIPPAFLVGVFGAFFAALSLSMATSLVISFFVAWLVIPLVAARWLRKHDVDPEDAGQIARKAFAIYEAMLRPVLKFPAGAGGWSFRFCFMDIMNINGLGPDLCRPLMKADL